MPPGKAEPRIFPGHHLSSKKTRLLSLLVNQETLERNKHSNYLISIFTELKHTHVATAI